MFDQSSTGVVDIGKMIDKNIRRSGNKFPSNDFFEDKIVVKKERGHPRPTR